MLFFNIFSVVKGEDMKFVRQLHRRLKSTIKYRLKKKYASIETCCRFLYAESSAGHRTAAKQMLISLLESPHGIRFENVYSKSLQQLKYRNLENLLAPIEEIGYFTFSK